MYHVSLFYSYLCSFIPLISNPLQFCAIFFTNKTYLLDTSNKGDVKQINYPKYPKDGGCIFKKYFKMIIRLYVKSLILGLLSLSG